MLHRLALKGMALRSFRPLGGSEDLGELANFIFDKLVLPQVTEFHTKFAHFKFSTVSLVV